MRNAGLIQTFGPSLGGGDCGALCALPVAGRPVRIFEVSEIGDSAPFFSG